jgi:predicted metal-dependent hydrolase
MPDQFEQYYKYLKANGADVAPDFNSFKNTLSNYDNSSKYYSYLKDNQFDVPDSYDSFADTFGLKKKDGGIVSGPIPSKLPSKGVLEQGIEMAQKGFVVKPQEQSTFSKVEQSLGKVKNAYDAIQYLKDAPPEFGGVSKEDEQLANQNYANAEKEKQNLLKTYSKDIYSSVDELLSNNGYKNLFDGNVFNAEKARGILDEKVKSRGGGSFLRETLLAELKKRAQSDFDKPVMDKLVQEEFKAAGINVDSLMSKYGKDLFNKLSAKQQSILPIIKQEAEKESVGVLNNAKEIANSLGGDFTNYVNDLNNKIKSGQLDEQTAKQLFDEKKIEYDNGLAKLNEDYQKMVRNVNVKINDRFGRIENEMKKISNSITNEDVFKALPPKDRQKIEEVYSRASQKLAERKNQIVRASDVALGLPEFAGKALISGFNKGLADIGGYLQMNGSDNKFTDWLLNKEQTAEGTAIGQYEWNGKDWYKRAIGGSMQSIGASAPMLLPTLAVGLATQGRVLPAVSGALAGYVGYKGESMQNAGDAYKQRLAETGDVNKAYESASRVERDNKITLPFYFIGGLGTMKLLQGGGKIGSFLKGAALEQAEEIPTEYIQQYDQAKENGYSKGIGLFIKENPEIAFDTLITTLGQSGAMAAVGKAIGKIDTSASQPTTQFYADLIKNEGVQFANSVLQNYYNTGVIDEKKFQEQKMELLKVAQSMQKVQNLGVSPEKAQVVTILNANVEDLKKQVEEETDQAAKVILEGKLRQAQADLRGISDNTTPYLVLTLPGGQNSTRIMTMQEYEQLKEEGKIDGIIQAADKVRVVNDNELNSEVNKIKEKVGNPEDTADGAYTGGKPAEEFSSVMPYVIEDRDIVEPVIQKIQNNELVNEEDLYKAAQVLEKLQSETDNQSLKNLINPLIDKILTYENQSKTEVSTVTEKGAVTRVGTDVGKKTVSKALGQFEGSRATITDRNGKKVTGYLKLENGTYNLYDENGNQIESIGEKQITDRDVVLPSTDVVPNPIELDENGNIKSITLQLQKVNKEIGILPDRLITIEFQDAEKALDYAIQLRAEQVGEFSDPQFEEIITQVEQEIPISKIKKDESIQDKGQPTKQLVEAADEKAEQKRKEESDRDAAKRKEVKETLINLRNEGVLVTADKSILGKLKKAIGIKQAPMTDAEIDAQMTLLDAMAKVWKQTTGLDNFYDAFIADIKKGDVKDFKNKGGVLFQNIENPIAPVSRVTLSMFKEMPQFQKMIGQMVNPQSIADLIKSNGKQIEKDIITDVLNFEKYKGVKRISFDEFRDDVETQIMKLEKIRTDSYASYGRDNLGDNVSYGSTETIIFNSPIDHGEKGHFSGDFINVQVEKRTWELKQIFGTDTWVAMDKNMPSGIPQDQIQNYVGTAGTEENVQRWINQRQVAGGPINKGLFGHIRNWFNKSTGIWTIAELQSDVFQKMKATELLADEIPKEEIDEYMNKNFWNKFNKEYSDQIVKDLNLQVIPFKEVYNLNKQNIIQIARYEMALEKVKNTREFNQINEELDKLYKIDRGFKELTRINFASFENMKNAEGIAVFDKEGNFIKYSDFKYEDRPGVAYGEYETYQLINNAAKEIANNFDTGTYADTNKRFVRKNNADYIEFDTNEQREEYIKDLYGRYPREYFSEMKNMYMAKTAEFKVEEQKYIQKRLEEQTAKFTSIEKQFIASQKFHEVRLLREAFKNAAEEGGEVVRFPTPYTIAIIEGYVNKQGESGAPYEIISGDDNRLEFGDVISMDGNKYYVLDSNSNTITVAPQDSAYMYEIESFKDDEKNNRISEIEYEAKKHFNDMNNITLEEIESYEPDEYMGEIAKKLLQEKFQERAEFISEEVSEEDFEEVTISWNDIDSKLDDQVYDEYSNMGIDDLLDGFGELYTDGYGINAIVVEGRGQIETLHQPDEYDATTNEDDFEKELSDKQKTVVNKYKELNKVFQKLRKDARFVRDDNDMQWIETTMTDEDRQNPIIAFQQEGGDIKGAIDFVNDNKASVYVFDGADISTLAHEFTGHLGRRFLEKLAETNDAFRKDYESVMKWAEVKDDIWTTRAEEKFARAFERYLREGKSPTKALSAVFENLKKWLTQIYNTIKGSSIDIELTQEVRDVFGGLLGAKAEGTLAEVYENIPKESKLSTKNAVKTLINDNFEEIKKQLENKKICQ